MHHQGPISAIAAFGPYVATAGYDNKIILWDSHRRKALSRGLHDHLVNHCAFNTDGTLLASGSSDYTARIWEVPSMRLRSCLSGHTDDVDMAVFSPDDQWIATCALDRTIRIFDQSGQCHNVLFGHTGNIISVAWRPNGKTLVSSSVDGTVREWDAQSGACIACHDVDGIRTDSFAIATSGVIYAGDDQGRIVIIQNHDGESGMAFHAAHQAGIKKVVYDPAYQSLVTLSYDRTLAIWAIQPDHSVRLVRRTECPALIWARSAAFIDSHRIAMGTFGSHYAIYDAQADAWDLDDIIPDSSLNSVLISQSNQFAIGDAGVLHRNGVPTASTGSLCNFLVDCAGLVLTGGQMGRLFNAQTGSVLYEHHSPLNCGTSFTRHGMPHVAIGAYTGEILVFSQAVPGVLKLETILHPYENAVKGLSSSKDRLFSVCANTDIAWHNLEDFSLVRRVNRAHERIANGCARAGETGFASIGRDRKLRLWLETGDEVYDTPHPNSVKCICADDTGTILMTGAYTGTVAAFDLKTRSWISFERPTAAGISSISYDPRQRRFWASSYDGLLYGLDVIQPFPTMELAADFELELVMQAPLTQEHCA